MPDANPTLLIGTRKGAFLLHGTARRDAWTLDGPHFLGHQVHHLVAETRAVTGPPTLLAATRAGHLGPTLFRSTDRGHSWTEVHRPPAFPKAPEGETGRAVHHVFWLAPGHADAPGSWYAGTSPPALFHSDDDGESWAPVAGFNDHPLWATWTQGGDDGTPDGSLLHSINIDPRDPRHLYVGLSGGGVFESTDGGADWAPLNAGCEANFNPDPYPEFGHDPHCLRLHPLAPDVLWQQNHCGIYRMERPTGTWQRVGDNMPREIGDIGFPITLHPRDPDTAWVFPMDGTDVWPRTSPDGRPAVYRTRDAGRSWTRCDGGLPPRDAWLTVFRQAMAADDATPLGLYFGTTCGEVWASDDEGDHWHCIARHLPDVYAVECVTGMGAAT
ncbi:MAG TPA: hypothetical protein VLA56_12155 [Pseudomonadales bacterium]|nr:hypothetical protein [Pseudomonadales bacterium]